MKTLILVRHAKSSHEHTSLTDFDRPLNERGLRNAQEMARRISKRGVSVQAIVTSPAVRALRTAEFLRAELKPPAYLIEEKIYEAGLFTLLHIVNKLNDDWSNVMLVGHNPGFSELATYLGNTHIEMPTCAIVELQFPLNRWALVSKYTGKLVEFDFPKKGLQ